MVLLPTEIVDYIGVNKRTISRELKCNILKCGQKAGRYKGKHQTVRLIFVTPTRQNKSY